jgi:hypothetical protein
MAVFAQGVRAYADRGVGSGSANGTMGTGSTGTVGGISSNVASVMIDGRDALPE